MYIPHTCVISVRTNYAIQHAFNHHMITVMLLSTISTDSSVANKMRNQFIPAKTDATSTPMVMSPYNEIANINGSILILAGPNQDEPNQ